MTTPKRRRCASAATPISRPGARATSDPASLCKLGRAEIAQGSRIGRLLRAK
ncbi:MAG: DUF5333 domain-containing protein [Roseovarius sp.]|nr:DUF5333 domain-containing protein [Roseovarius sp.]